MFSPFSRAIVSHNKAGLTVNKMSCQGNRPRICANRLLNNPEQFSIGHSSVFCMLVIALAMVAKTLLADDKITACVKQVCMSPGCCM